MKLADLDHSADIGNKPITIAVRWLRTLMARSTWTWNAEQLAGCKQIADQVENMLELDVEVLELGAEVHPKGTRNKLELLQVRLDALVAWVEDGGAAAAMVSENADYAPLWKAKELVAAGKDSRANW
jgi:hypothetical protein